MKWLLKSPKINKLLIALSFSKCYLSSQENIGLGEKRGLSTYENFLAKLNKQLDIDLIGYKRPQMERRINSLMRTLQIKNYDEFIEKMKSDPAILKRFLQHLTINVSEFFRNPSQWEVLREKIIPLLLANSKDLRIWSAGCSTGEEPYSLAILLKEYFPYVKYSLLATDFDIQVLEKAKAGVYSSNEVSGVPPKLINKYFLKDNDVFQIKPELKKDIIFKRHNLLRDPFSTNFDLIVCRNVVIYFTEETKNILYRKFYASLKSKGVLFTGSTEQIMQAREIGFTSPAIFFYQKT